jgi:hypothetical protein
MRKVRAVEIDAWPLAARIAGSLSSNGWQVVMAEPGSEVDAADALVDELRSLSDGRVRWASVHVAEELLDASKADNQDILVISIESKWSDEDWRRIDVQRSRLMREGTTVLVVGEDDVAAMVISAPNLWSWVGGEVWSLRIEGNGR